MGSAMAQSATSSTELAQVVLLRHGQSDWNLENRFTGWIDVDLSPAGRVEAEKAGALLEAKGYQFDLAYTSVLKRAIRTCWITLDRLNQLWLPMVKDWRLNERHYGALAGLNKSETAAQYGEEQVLIWRRSYSISPNPISKADPNWPGHDPRYAGIPEDQLPLTECLADTVARVEPFWKDRVLPELKAGKRILIAAHGNSLRALLKLLAGMTEEEVLALNIPTAQPLALYFDSAFQLVRREYLADPKEIEAALAAVANQGKASPSGQ